MIILRIESSILYFNADNIQEKIGKYIEGYQGNLKLVVLDLSPASYVDVAGSKILLQLSEQLQQKGIQLKIVEALSNVRDLLRMQGMEEIIGHISRRVSVDDVVQEFLSGRK
jgi:anti-anti-sigma factor